MFFVRARRQLLYLYNTNNYFKWDFSFLFSASRSYHYIYIGKYLEKKKEKIVEVHFFFLVLREQINCFIITLYPRHRYRHRSPWVFFYFILFFHLFIYLLYFFIFILLIFLIIYFFFYSFYLTHNNKVITLMCY